MAYQYAQPEIMPQDSIEKLRSKYRAEKAEAERRLAGISAKLQVLDELAAEEQMINGGLVTATSVSDNRIPEGLTAGCEWIVNKHGLGTSLQTSDVKNYLAHYGYKPNGKNFPVTLFKTLKRLVKSGRISGEKVGSTWAFRVK